MNNAATLLTQFFNQPANSIFANGQPPPINSGGIDLQHLLSGRGGLVTAILAGGLAGILLGGKKPRKLAKRALQVGGIALVSGLAYKAWQGWRAQKQPQKNAATQWRNSIPSADNPFLPTTPYEEADLSRKLVRAMVGAAKADGHITPEEHLKIAEQLRPIGLRDEDQALILAELSQPTSIDSIASSVQGIEEAAEVYAASLLMLESPGEAEQGYLKMLAARLGLEPDFVAHLHASVETADRNESRTKLIDVEA